MKSGGTKRRSLEVENKICCAFETQEGCLSLSGVRKCTRYREIEMTWQDMNFKTQKQKFSGWTAQIIQHEADHLAGLLSEINMRLKYTFEKNVIVFCL